MIPCRACALVHSPLERCEVARRRAGIEVHRIEAGPVKTRQNPTKPTKCRESDALGSLRSDDQVAVDTLVASRTAPVTHKSAGREAKRRAKLGDEYRRRNRERMRRLRAKP